MSDTKLDTNVIPVQRALLEFLHYFCMCSRVLHRDIKNSTARDVKCHAIEALVAIREANAIRDPLRRSNLIEQAKHMMSFIMEEVRLIYRVEPVVGLKTKKKIYKYAKLTKRIVEVDTQLNNWQNYFDQKIAKDEKTKN